MLRAGQQAFYARRPPLGVRGALPAAPGALGGRSGRGDEEARSGAPEGEHDPREDTGGEIMRRNHAAPAAAPAAALPALSVRGVAVSAPGPLEVRDDGALPEERAADVSCTDMPGRHYG